MSTTSGPMLGIHQRNSSWTESIFKYTHEKNVCFVWVPTLEDFPSDMHSMYTDKKHQLKLEDKADLPI